MNLLPLFEWCENSGAGRFIRSSAYWFPAVEAFHLLALAVIGGAVLLVDLRLSGLLLTHQPQSRIGRDAEPWLVASLGVMLVSGALLFASEAVKCYYNGAFWVKMVSLALAIAFTFTIRRKASRSDSVTPAWGRIVAGISVLLWSLVGMGGRGIGFF